MKRIATIACGLLAAQVASAGVYVELFEENTATGKSALEQKMYLQDGSGRFVDPEGHVSLIKGDTLYVIDEKAKTYVMLDQATMQQLAKQLSAAMEQMKEQLAKLPPDQRAQMEQMLGGAGMAGAQERTVEVKDTGKSDKVDGRTCKLWDVTRDGVLDQQICVVPFSALPGKENFSAVFAKFAKIFEDMAKTVPALSGMMANEFSAHAKVNGFPVRQRSYENGKLINEQTVVKVWREEEVPASTFEIPAGYKRKAMDMPGQ